MGRRCRALDADTFTALQSACFRLAGDVGLTAPGGVVTADATGLERHHVSAHLVDRCGALRVPAAVRHAVRFLAPATVFGDARYDADHNDRICRTLGIATSVIALNARNMGRRSPLAPERRALRRRVPRELHRPRWYAESVFSRHKRRLGSALTARARAPSGATRCSACSRTP